MKNILIKIRFIYVRYLIISIGFILIYSTLRWYFDYELGLIHLKEDLLNFWFPFLLPSLPLAIWLRREIRILDLKGRDDGYFVFLLVAGLTIFVPTLIAQQYVKASSSKLSDVRSVYEIKQARSIDCYTIKDFKVVPDYLGSYRTSRVSGKYNQHLDFTTYFVVPIVDNFNPVDFENHMYWYAFKFTERMSNHADHEEKDERWRAFYEECRQKYEQYNFLDFQYLQGISFSDDRDGYIEAIKSRQETENIENLIILEPIHAPFAQKTGNKYAWIFGSFGIGAFVFLLMILIPSVNKTEFQRYIDKKPLREDDFKDILKFLIPRGDHFISSILININLLVFLYLVFSGINVISATPKELLELGGSRRSEVLNGEYSRLFTSTFLHAGIVHILMNLVAIGIICSLIEPILGRWQTLIAYLISGVGAGLVSVCWYENTVSVGASGAIFGMMGVMTALLITKKDKGLKGIYLLILGLYGGLSLLLGLSGGVDNAAHIGGLLTGLLIGLLIIFMSKNEQNHKKLKR